MSMAKRVQRKRVKGWKMPPNTVYVGRPSKWGNPYTDAAWEGRYRAMLRATAMLPIIKRELRGKNLACWCSLDEICHADILLDIANQASP